MRHLLYGLTNMPGDARPWSTAEWENHIQLLLKKRYAHPTGSYQQISATVHGDCGLEGFAVDRTAYQCYAAQECMNSQQLYTKQRNKITTDIGKFIKNENALLEILGGIRIGFWNFVVPYWTDKELLKHAATKTNEVRALKLKHADEDFRISILTAEDFAIEAQLLARIDLYKFDPQTPSVSSENLSMWMTGTANLDLVKNLARKAALIGAGKSEISRNRFQARMAANYIGGNIVLGQLEQELPETYGKVIDFKTQREADLEAESFSTNKVPSEFFESTLQQYRSELANIPGISPRTAATLAKEAVADWLFRCPMDFD
ncbi:MAG: hypothetical protein WAM66_06785 [Acidobacteriaceae bacterium]